MSNLEYLKNWLYHHDSNTKTSNNYREMLREFESFFEYIFNFSRDGISILDLDFTILGVNNTIDRWYSHIESLVGKKCFQVYRDNISPCIDCPTREAMRTKKPCSAIIAFDVPGSANGRQELSVFPLFDDHNHMFGFVEYARNIHLREGEEVVIDNLKNRLQLKDQNLQEQESALKVILRHNEKSEERLAAVVTQNMKIMVDPLLVKLEKRLDNDSSRKLMHILRERLNSITSPFLKKLSINSVGFTKRELEVAVLIREGETSKEIASILGISEKGVEFHRLKLREKLGLSHTSENLYSYLLSLDPA